MPLPRREGLGVGPKRDFVGTDGLVSSSEIMVGSRADDYLQKDPIVRPSTHPTRNPPSSLLRNPCHLRSICEKFLEFSSA